MAFEYKVEYLIGSHGVGLVRELNAFGAEGWELICRQGDEFIFRRPKTKRVWTTPVFPKFEPVLAPDAEPIASPDPAPESGAA